MKKGQQQEPLQDQIERLEDEINDAIHKVEENSLFAPGCVRRAQPYRAHLGHKWAAKCVLEHILSHTGELQEELNRMYDEAFTDFMTDFVTQVRCCFLVCCFPFSLRQFASLTCCCAVPRRRRR